MKESIQIQMFGGFSLRCGESIIDYQKNRSNKLWTVLAYLLTFHDKKITQDELIEILWEDESVENPSNTLKTLRHRLCSMLDGLDTISGKELIRYNHGVYSWNTEVPYVIDTDLFMENCKLGDTAEEYDQKIAHYMKALEYYAGDFLPRLASELWVMSLHAYYHTEYLRVVKQCILLLEEAKRFHDIITVCQKAVEIEPYDEELHASLIKALVQSGNKQSALAHYEKVQKLFYHEFGINLSEDLVDLYKVIIEEQNEVEVDLCVIKRHLQESHSNGAFYCEYALFKEIYRLITRMTERNGQSVYLCLVSLSDKNEGKKMMGAGGRDEAMGELRTTIQHSLRRGDVFTRYSVSQYLLLLSAINYENTEMVLNRIAAKFRKENPNYSVKLQMSMQSVL